MLTQVREDEVTIKYCAKAHFANTCREYWDLGKARKYFLQPVTKLANTGYWVGSAKIFSSLKNYAIEKQGKC